MVISSSLILVRLHVEFRLFFSCFVMAAVSFVFPVNTPSRLLSFLKILVDYSQCKPLMFVFKHRGAFFPAKKKAFVAIMIFFCFSVNTPSRIVSLLKILVDYSHCKPLMFLFTHKAALFPKKI